MIKVIYINTHSTIWTYNLDNAVKVIMLDTGKDILVINWLLFLKLLEPPIILSLIKNHGTYPTNKNTNLGNPWTFPSLLKPISNANQSINKVNKGFIKAHKGPNNEPI